MSQTITIQCESCAEVRDALRQLYGTMEKLVTALSASNDQLNNGKPSKQKDGSDHNGDPELLSLTQFAKRKNFSRQTAYKWARYHKYKFPYESLVREPLTGRYLVNWDVYKKAYEVIA